MSTIIPKIIIQTSVRKQPQYVIDMILHKSHGWEYQHYNDKEAFQYFIDHPLVEFPNMIEKFLSFSYGAHRADLFRYYIIYVQGGVFIDSDAMIEDNIENIVNDYSYFSVNSSYVKGTIFQGFIGAVPQNLIMYEALKDAYHSKNEDLMRNYHLLCKHMYEIIHDGTIIIDFPYKLYREQCNQLGANVYNDNDELILVHYSETKIIPNKINSFV